MGKIYKNTKHNFLALFVVLSGLLSAQVDVSSGGPVTTYSTVNDAFTAINAGTHTGVITINITGNTSEPTTPVALSANGVGSASYSSIRLQPTTQATISGAPVSGRAILEFNGSDSVLINGDISGGSIGRDLMIVNTNTTSTTASAVIRFIGTTTAPALGCRDVQIKNCIIMGNVNPSSTSPGTNIVGILAGGGTGATFATATTAGNNFDKFLIENNEVKRCYYGLIIAGNTAITTNADTLVIRKNQIGSSNATEYNLYRGVYLANCLAAKIIDNTIFNQIALNGTSIAAIDITGSAAVASNDSIVRNTIYGIHMPSTGGWGAYGINIAAGNNHTMVNNVIYDITTTNYSNTSTTYNAFGIRLSSGTGHKLYYNSINMYGNYSYASNTTCAAAALVVTATGVNGLDIKNNIFNNKITSNAATKRFYAVWFPAAYNFGTTNLDNNAYMVSGVASSHYVGAIGTTLYSTMPLWRTAVQASNPLCDINSIPPANGNAPFIADNNLMINNNTISLIESGATVIPGLGLPNTDYLLNNRPKSGINPNLNPDMGAYEFDGIQDYLDVGVTAILKPLVAASKCYNGTDTIKIRVKNNYTNNLDMSVRNIPLKVTVSGPNPAVYTLTLTSGILAGNATLDTTITLNYNLSKTGVYTFKAFTELPSDASQSNDTTFLVITKKPLFDVTALPNDSVCRGDTIALNTQVNSAFNVGSGTITNSSTSYPAPYGNWYESAKHQFLFLASELSAAGLTAGNINGISFNATALNGTDPLTNFNIAIATTTMSAITAFQTTGFTTYYNSPSYVPVVGANNHVFSTPFVWNGTDNIIIETCFDNAGLGFSGNVSISQSTTPFTSSVWYRADATPGLCAMNNITGTMSQRPNIVFDQPVTMTYNWGPATNLSSTSVSNPTVNGLFNTTVYTLTLTNVSSGCIARDTINLYVKPTPVPALGNDTLLCTTPYILGSNTAASSYVWSNSATTSSISVTLPGTYWVKGMNSNGCIGSDTINITIGNKPIVTLGPDTAFCQGSSIVLHAGNSPGTYLWNTSATTNTINVTIAGTYSVTVTDPSSCKTSDIINVTVKSKPTVALTFTGQTVFCPNESGRVLNEGTPSGGMYIGAGVSGGNVFNANQAGNGTYIILYNYTASNGCSNIAKDTLKVNNCGVGLEELADNVGLNVYPNPNNGEFTIEINTTTEVEGKIKVLAIDSRLVFEDVVNGNGLITKTVNIGQLSDGIYYLRLETKGAVKTYKVLKQ